MSTTLTDALHTLFLVDQQVRGLESRLEGAQRHVNAQQTKIDQLSRQLQELKDQLRHTQAQEASAEAEAEGFEQRIEKLRDQMNNVKTNKEYSALLVEVNTLKVDKSKVEERALALLTQTETLQEEVSQVEGQLADQEKIKRVADQELARRTEEVSDQLEALKAQRAEAASHVPPDALAVFDRLAETTDGEAMTHVVQEDARRMEYTCGGCYMTIPAERVNQLYSADKLVRCPSCGRILYLDQETKAGLGTRS